MKDVPRNMRLTGMFLFRAAFREALQGETPMCVVHAAHAAEILLKARIAQEHPLLIFSKLPKSNPSKDALTLIDLLEGGRTLSYEELPDQLWATTGIKIEQLDQYRKFGRLRNQIIHFSMTNVNALDTITLRYSLEVLDPLVESFWGRSVIDFIKNDPHPAYYAAAEVECGILEESIRKKGFPIDQRLRQLLGEASREAWEEMQADNEQYHKFHESKTAKDWEAEYQDWSETQADSGDEYRELAEAQANWKTFLDSF
jgi:HEPN domain-containing protein